jgi:ubiquinone biosynthesis protein COQ4
MANQPSQRIRPLDAARAIRALIRDPDDTARVFDVIDALSGKSGERQFLRLKGSPEGARLLAERPSLLAVLSDREYLMGLPTGTLGRTYGEFMSREQLSADGLVQASIDGGSAPDPELPDERRWFGERLRDMHDLWHVTTGYGRDLLGEAALLAFSYAQLRNRGIGLIVAVAWWKSGDRHTRRVIREAYRRGKRSAWLPGQAWEAHLERPLDELRRELRTGEPVSYQPQRSAGAPALA